MVDNVEILDVKDSKNGEFTFQDKTISVKRFIPFDKQNEFIIEYVLRYFKDDEYSPMDADDTLVKNIIKSQTNVVISDEAVFDKLIYQTSFYDDLKAIIYNYEDFEKLLEKVVDEKKRLLDSEKALGPIVEKLFEKGFETLEKFSNITPENIDDIQKKTANVIKQINDSPISEPIADMKRNKKTSKKEKVEYVQ